MENQSKKNVKVYSYLFIFLAAWDVVALILNKLLGEMDFSSMIGANGVTASIVKAAWVVIIVITAIFALIKLFIGVRGLQLANGSGKYKGMLRFLKFLFVLEAIAFIIMLISLIQGTSRVVDILNPAASLVILGGFIKEIKTFLVNN